MSMSTEEHEYFLNLKAQARSHLNAMKRNRDKLKPSEKARALSAIAAIIWLAIGASRYEESYNEHGVRHHRITNLI
jgi:hypothetical protein